MEVCESKRAFRKQSTVVTTRRPLVPSDTKNGDTQARTREVNSRCRSAVPSADIGPKRCASPNANRLSSTSTLLSQKRTTSTERKYPSRSSSPQSLSTPAKDSTEMLAPWKLVGDRLPELLWPSTMRSLSVSFRYDTFSVPTCKKEKPVSHAPSDQIQKLSSNIAHRLAGNLALTLRNPTPERKRSPLKGKNSSDHSENSKPHDSFNRRLVDQHRRPSRTVSASQKRSLNLTNMTSKASSIFSSETVSPSSRRLSLDGTFKTPQKSTSDLLMLVSHEDNGEAMPSGCLGDGSSLQMQKIGSSSSLDRTRLANAAARAMSLQTPGSRPASPLLSRGGSAYRAKASNASSRGPSPARVRPSSPSSQSKNSTSVLSFIADIKKGKKVANHIEDAHQLRLLYNRHLQWRYTNARTDTVLRSQKAKAEKVLYSILRVVADLWDLIMKKRIDLQQLKLELNLYIVLSNQLTYLDDWASIEKDHFNSLTSVSQDLQSSTVRIPLMEGARGDIETVKKAVCYAVAVMQAVGSSLRSVLPRVKGMNCLVSKLANVVAKERAMLDQCESILGLTSALQVEEYSRMANLLQMTNGGWRNREQSLCGY